jgi:cellulose synthase/poly-beta-1,6-N-acetylglucosamine synthase-like glycosyltransferase
MPDPSSSSLPFVSVVIPTLNCRNDIDACLAALEKQDYPRDRFEVIVADNGSTDGTREHLEKTWVKLCLCPQRGRARALNAGLAVARGEIICTTDLSCLAAPDWISTVVSDFDNPEVGCVAGDIKLLKTGMSNRVIDFQERVNYMSPMLALNRQQLPFMPFADGASASFRKQVFDEIGGFEDSFIKAADVEICYRMFALTRYKILFDYRLMMWEPGEPTLGALLHQRYRMGIGWNLLRMKYPLLFAERSDSSLKEVYWSFREKLGRFGNLLVGNLGALFGQARDETYDANIRYLMSQIQAVGRLYGRWHLRSRGIQPIPVDSEAQKNLIAAGGAKGRVLVIGEAKTPVGAASAAISQVGVT